MLTIFNMAPLFPGISDDDDKPKTYQSLWNSLERPNKAKFEYPRGHQLKLLERIEEEFRSVSGNDFALSLPTGTGKTVIGLLLAYFTMLTKSVKAIYLCPNKFLCDQVLNEAKDLGVPAVSLYGSWKNVPQEGKGLFLNGQAVGVATYSTLFNSSPKTGEVGMVIMDDIHSSGDAIISNWYIRINKEENPKLYRLALETIGPTLNKRQKDALNTPPAKVELFEMMYSKQWLSIVDDLGAVFDKNEKEVELKYVWKWCKPKVEDFLCLLSYHTVELRPITPPSHTIDEFRKAKFRVYMSATIDKTGNLENMVGIENLQWIEDSDIDVPGNRLILNLESLIPKASDVNRVTLIAQKIGRLIVLAQSKTQQQIIKSALKTVKYTGKIYTPTKLDISADLKDFKNDDKAIIILAGRYDGIDLGEGAANGILVYHLPEAINTLEHFETLEWQTRDEARGRAIQRIHQGMGRCTRKESDEVMVFLVGEDLVKTLLAPQTLNSFPGKLRLELQTCKKINDPSTLDEFISEFMKNGPNWMAQKSTVNKNASKSLRKTAPTVPGDLARFVFSKYNNLKWIGNYDAAVSLASGIARKLYSQGQNMDSSVWYYLAGLSSDLKCFLEGSDPYKAPAHGYFDQAVSNSSQREWFGNLSNYLIRSSHPHEISERVERIAEFLRKFPPENDSLDQEFSEILKVSASRKDLETKVFLKALGETLGYDTLSPKRHGSPDCIWYIGSEAHFIFEAKLDKSNDTISINEARQIISQPSEVRTMERFIVPDNLKTTCLTDVNYIDGSSSYALDQFYVWRSTSANILAQRWFSKLALIHKRSFKDNTYLKSLVEDALTGFNLDSNGLNLNINGALAKSVLKTV